MCARMRCVHAWVSAGVVGVRGSTVPSVPQSTSRALRRSRPPLRCLSTSSRHATPPRSTASCTLRLTCGTWTAHRGGTAPSSLPCPCLLCCRHCRCGRCTCHRRHCRCGGCTCHRRRYACAVAAAALSLQLPGPSLPHLFGILCRSLLRGTATPPPCLHTSCCSQTTSERSTTRCLNSVTLWCVAAIAAAGTSVRRQRLRLLYVVTVPAGRKAVPCARQWRRGDVCAQRLGGCASTLELSRHRACATPAPRARRCGCGAYHRRCGVCGATSHENRHVTNTAQRCSIQYSQHNRLVDFGVVHRGGVVGHSARRDMELRRLRTAILARLL